MKDLLTIAEIKELALNEELTVTRIEQNGSGGYAITGFNSVEDAESFANDYNLNLPLVFNESGSLTRHEIGVLLPRE